MNNTNAKFQANQIVKGHVCGTFVVLAVICNDEMQRFDYQVKPICSETHRPYPGELRMEESALVAA